ncbi:MAG: AmmeMemoRadiSam system protein A [Clostridiales Family XIII bacterium]|nr:AmmeMemoRadiSam system protein A [Clostridiales Family XIII bacterium]
MGIIGAFILPHPPLIIPDVGNGQERLIQSTIDSFVHAAERIRSLAPDTIVVITPHNVLYSDYFHISPGQQAQGDFRRFGAGGVKVSADYDPVFVAALADNAAKEGLSAGSLGEKDSCLDHGAMIPLFFVNRLYADYKLVRVCPSCLPYADHYRLGMCIDRTCRDLGRRAVIIASGDLSHKLKHDGPYGFAPEGPEFDRRVTSVMESGDFLEFMSIEPSLAGKAAECGLRPFIIMAGALDARAVEPRLLSYEGPFGVGYAAASFMPGDDDSSRRYLERYFINEKIKLQNIKDNEDEYARLARYALETWMLTRKRPALPQILPKEMLETRAGVFVSLKKHGELRGCIGTVLPSTGNVAEEIMHNTLDAALSDSRFEPVSKTEMGDLIYSVYVLSPPEAVDSVHDLDPQRYGVIVTHDSKRGLLLPGIDGIFSREQQLSIALEKAGIDPDANYRIERFETSRHI